jgi:hypothetical protein
VNGFLLAAVGGLTGLHAATWGAFKDSRFEGFRRASFRRSVYLGIACSLMLASSGTVTTSSGVLVVVGLCYASERLVTEWWKAIVREDPQDGYSIPMRLAVSGRPVDARGPRYVVGAAIALGLVITCLVASRVDGRVAQLPWWGMALLGGIGGWLTAIGGAWKDAPIEGFQRVKFFRSPVVATIWGCLLVPFASSLPVLAVAAGGWSVVSIETYKTVLAGGPPGKFAGKPQRFDATRARSRCRLIHALLYVVLIGALLGDLLNGRGAATPGHLYPNGALLLVLVWAAGFGAVVLRTANSATVGGSHGSDRPAESSGRLGNADIRGAST